MFVNDGKAKIYNFHLEWKGIKESEEVEEEGKEKCDNPQDNNDSPPSHHIRS